MNFIKSININVVIFFIIFIFLSNKNSLIKNVFEITKFKEPDRIKKIYGYCGQESIGYLKHIKKKYNLKGNPKIINYDHTPPVLWSIYDPIFNEINNKEIIILNYPGKYFQVELNRISDDIFELKDSHYFSTISKNIRYIYSENPKLKIYGLEFYKNDYTDDSFLLKTISVTSSNSGKYEVNVNLNEFQINENKLFIKILSNGNYDKNSTFKINLENKLNLNKYKIIDKFKNCYFLK